MIVAGTDEAGRGPLAGPVTAAAVILPPGAVPLLLAEGLADSKRLSARARERLFVRIRAEARAVRAAAVSWRRIDETDILAASQEAMRRALLRLPLRPDLVVVDGTRPIPDLPFPQVPLVRGDARSAPVMAASIVAKVLRDRVMVAFDRLWPQYGFRRHKGYPTEGHRDALLRHGPCPIHRRSFRGVVA